MEFKETVEKRRSVRGYTSDPVPQEAADAILAAGQLAPIGMAKFKAMHISVVTDPELLAEIAQAGSEWGGLKPAAITYNAPLLYIISSEAEDPCIPAHPDEPLTGLNAMNTGCIIENMLLAATDQGLASIFLYSVTKGINNTPELKAKLEIPEGFVVQATAAVGYPAQEVKERTNMAPIPVSFH